MSDAEQTRRTRRPKEEPLSGDINEICASPEQARRVARQLAALAGTHVTPGRTWSMEDVRDVLEAAVRTRHTDSVEVLPGREFRRRLRAQCVIAERYQERFACVVLSVAAGLDSSTQASVLDAITERLRSTDVIFLYKRRFALILPRMRPEALEPAVTRVRNLIAIGAGPKAITGVASLVFPSGSLDPNGVLDWAEDQLRD